MTQPPVLAEADAGGGADTAGLREWEDRYRLRPIPAGAVSRWSATELGRELEQAGLAACVEPFARARIDGRTALTITAEVRRPRHRCYRRPAACPAESEPPPPFLLPVSAVLVTPCLPQHLLCHRATALKGF